MKAIIEKTVEEHADPSEMILEYLSKDSWIFVSYGIIKRLKELYPDYESFRCASPEGWIFWIRKDGYDERWKENKGLCLSIEEGSTWQKVRGFRGPLNKEDPNSEAPYATSDPDQIVFLN